MSSSSLSKLNLLKRLSLNSSGGTRGEVVEEESLDGEEFKAQTKIPHMPTLELKDVMVQGGGSGDDKAGENEDDENLALRDLYLGDEEEGDEDDLLEAMLRRVKDRVKVEERDEDTAEPIMIRSVGEIHKAYRERVAQEEKRQQLSRRRLFHKQQQQQQQQQQPIRQTIRSKASPARRTEIRKEEVSLPTLSFELNQEVVVVEELTFARYSTDFSWRSELESFLSQALGHSQVVILRTQPVAPEDAREGKMVLKNIFYSVMHLTDSRDGLIPFMSESFYEGGSQVSYEMHIKPRGATSR